MADAAFREGDVDVQFLERRTDLLEPVLSETDARRLAIAAALAEDDARRSHRPAVAPDNGDGSAWQRQARLEGTR